MRYVAPLPPALTTVLVLLALACGPAAQAQVYKWVDAQGRTHYSNTAPADGKTAAKAVPVEDRVTSYTPDESLKRAQEQAQAREAREKRSSQQAAERKTESRVDKLERDLDAERQARRKKEEEEERLRQSGTGGLTTGAYVPVYVPLPVNRKRQPFAPPYDPATFYGPDNSTPIGINNAPKAGISTAAPAGINTSSPVGINNAPPVGVSTAPKIGVNSAPPVGGKPSSAYDNYRESRR